MWLIHSPSPSVRGVPCFSRTNLFSFILSGLISHHQSGQFPPDAMCVKCLCVLNTFWKKSVCGPACVSSKAEAFKGPAWVSCAIFYRDCISGSVCLTLPVRSWIKTGCCCQACFHSAHLDLCGCHFIGTHHSSPLLTCHFPANHRFTGMIFSETGLGPDCLALCPEKRHASGARATESRFMCKLSFGLYCMACGEYTCR